MVTEAALFNWIDPSASPWGVWFRLIAVRWFARGFVSVHAASGSGTTGCEMILAKALFSASLALILPGWTLFAAQQDHIHSSIANHCFRPGWHLFDQAGPYWTLFVAQTANHCFQPGWHLFDLAGPYLQLKQPIIVFDLVGTHLTWLDLIGPYLQLNSQSLFSTWLALILPGWTWLDYIYSSIANHCFWPGWDLFYLAGPYWTLFAAQQPITVFDPVGTYLTWLDLLFALAWFAMIDCQKEGLVTNQCV